MTKTYDHFLAQFHATGSEKCQGYDESHFIGLTDDEKKEVFTLLESELIAPGVAGWLHYLDPQKAIATLIDYVSAAGGKPLAGKHRVYIALYVFTQDASYLDRFEKDFPNFYVWEKEDAVNLYAGYVDDNERKKQFFITLIVNEQDADVLSSVADFYLRLEAVPITSPAEKAHFFAIRKLLESTSANDKRQGFMLVGTI